MRQNGYELSLVLADEGATLEAGARLAPALAPGVKIYLSGELGSGKTTLVRGVLRGLHFQGRVKSPTYTLVELYKFSRLDLYHFDFYRFTNSREWELAGFRDCFSESAVVIAEWPEKVGDLLPNPDLAIELTLQDAGRRLSARASTDLGRQCLNALGADQ